MIKIKYSRKSIEDIKETYKCILDMFQEKEIAEKYKHNITDAISRLKDQPSLGLQLKDKYPINDETIRYIIVNKQIIFYTYKDKNIEIIRILDSHTDYLSYLFK